MMKKKMTDHRCLAPECESLNYACNCPAEAEGVIRSALKNMSVAIEKESIVQAQVIMDAMAILGDLASKHSGVKPEKVVLRQGVSVRRNAPAVQGENPDCPDSTPPNPPHPK